MAKRIRKIKVSRAYKRLGNPKLVSFAKTTKFQGDHDAISPIHDDAAVHGAADNLMDGVSLAKLNPSTQNTSAVTVLRNILLDMLDDNANYLEIIANKVAKAAGDYAAGTAVVERIGFQVTGQGGGKRNIGFIDAGVGWAHAHEDKARKGTEGHVWKAGITDAKDTPPKETNTYYGVEADFIFTGAASGGVLAYCHGSVVPVNQKTTPSGQAPSGSILSKSASMTSMSSKKHPTCDINQKTNVVFGPWRYIVIP